MHDDNIGSNKESDNDKNNNNNDTSTSTSTTTTTTNIKQNITQETQTAEDVSSTTEQELSNLKEQDERERRAHRKGNDGGQRKSDDDDDDDDEEENNNNNVRYRQYLRDRANGKSKINASSKPPCFGCYVPMPVIWLAPLIEQNRIFEWMGNIGCFHASNLRARRFCIGTGLILNILGTFASIYTCFAISMEFDIIDIASFTIGLVTVESPTPEGIPNDKWDYKVKTGMRAVAIDEYTYAVASSNITEMVVSFDEFCDLPPAFSSNTQRDCDACANVSSSIVKTLIISLIMCYPSITTDVLRLYPGYDCNCQKVFASFAASISVAFAFYTLCIYQFRCFKSFDYGETCVDPDTGDIISTENTSSCVYEGYLRITRNYYMGPGWIALCVGTCFKVLDMLLNLAIPTPTICRDHEEQKEYELRYQHDDEEGEQPDGQEEEQAPGNEGNDI